MLRGGNDLTTVPMDFIFKTTLHFLPLERQKVGPLSLPKATLNLGRKGKPCFLVLAPQSNKMSGNDDDV